MINYKQIFLYRKALSRVFKLEQYKFVLFIHYHLSFLIYSDIYGKRYNFVNNYK